MHSASLSFLSSFPFVAFLGLLLQSSTLFPGANAAITTPINRNGDYVERNTQGRFCYYPTAIDPTTIDVACVGSEKGDYAQVMAAHLNTTTSINYFSASLQRLGGPEWPVNNSRNRKIYLCLSGRAGDYTYQTMCTTVGRDNSLGSGGPSPYCKVEVGQRRVTDGCYIPNQPLPSVSVLGATTRRPAVITVTRSSGTSVATTVTRNSAAQSDQQGSASKPALYGVLTSLLMVLVTMAIRL